MSAAPSNLKKPRILVVEDEAIVARDIQQQLEELGYEAVGLVARGDDAITLAGELRPDLVLMDIHLLGEMDGIAAARAIRERFGLPVVFLTAFAEDDTLGRAARAEPFEYIIKPSSAREMHAVLELALYKHRAEAMLRSSETRNAAITQSVHDAIITTDSAGTIVDWNHGAETVFGYTAAQATGQLVSLLVPERYLEGHLAGLERVRQGGAHHIIGKTAALTGRRKGGSEFPLELSLARWESVEGWFITAIARDVTEGERAAQAVQEAAARYRTLVEGSTEPLVVHRNGRMVYGNPAALRMFGIPAGQDIVGTPILDWVHRDSRALVQARAASLSDGSSATAGMVEMKVTTVDGTTIDVESHAIAIDYDGTPAVQVAMRDITARKRAEDEMRRVEQRFRDVVNSMPGIVWEADATTFTFTYVSGNAERLLGYDKADWLTPGFWANHLHADDAEQATRFCVSCTLQMQDHEFEYRFIARDGRAVWLHDSVRVVTEDGKPRWLRGLLVDITERKASADALRESASRVAAFFEASPIGISVTRVDDGTALEVNDAALRHFGYSHDEVIGHTMVKLGMYAVPAQRDLMVAQLRERGSITGFPIDFRKSSGEIGAMEVSARVVDLGGVPCVIAMMVDVSERKRAQAETEKLEAQLQHAQKMESVGRLAGGVAHDFNNMLGVILGTTEIALEQVDADHPLHADLREIQKAAQRSADLTRQLLAYARRQTIAPRQLNLNETVPGLLSMLQRLLGEDIRIVWRPSATLWPITMDPSQLANILTNLCINARDAIADVGTITIATTNQTIDAAFCAHHADAVPGDYARLTMRDTGSGMDDAVLAQIFEPFFTTKGVGKGTGLGLASVYGAVRQNRGFSAVSSVVGEGTTFDIYLPRLVDPVEAERESRAITPTARGRETLLLVEDEPGILQLTARLLERQGYLVLTAGSPAEAIHVAMQHDGEIHLLVTDVVMPGMNGRDLADALVRVRPQLRHVFMSGHTAGIIADRGMLVQGAAFIEKPFSSSALSAKVREVLDAGGDPQGS